MKQKQELKKWGKPKLRIIDFAKTNETVLVVSAPPPPGTKNLSPGPEPGSGQG